MEMVGFGKAGKERASPLSPRDLLQKRGNAKAQLEQEIVATCISR